MIQCKREYSRDLDLSRTGRRNAQIEIPEDAGIINLAEGHLCFKTKLDLETQGLDLSLFPFTLDMPAITMIRNVEEATGKHGPIASRLYQNQVNTNFQWYLHSRQEHEAAASINGDGGYYFKMGQYGYSVINSEGTGIAEDFTKVYDGMVGLNTVFLNPSVPTTMDVCVTETSTYGESVFRIPMKYLSSIDEQDLTELNVIELEGLTYKIELDPLVRNTDCPSMRPRYAADVTIDPSGNEQRILQVNDISYNQDNLKFNNLYVGAPVDLSWINPSGATVGYRTIVEQLRFDSSTSNLVVQVQDGVLGNAGDVLTSVTLQFADMDSTNVSEAGKWRYNGTRPELKIEQCWIEYYQYQYSKRNQIPKYKRITVLETLVQPERYVNNSYYDGIWQVPEDAIAAMVITCPDRTSADLERYIYSEYDSNNTKYRFALMGEDGVMEYTTGLDIDIINRRMQRLPPAATTRTAGVTTVIYDTWANRGLHNERLKEFFAVLGKQLKRYDSNQQYSIQTGNYTNFFRTGQVIYPQLILNNNKAIQFSLTTAGSTNKTILMVFFRIKALK